MTMEINSLSRASITRIVRQIGQLFRTTSRNRQRLEQLATDRSSSRTKLITGVTNATIPAATIDGACIVGGVGELVELFGEDRDLGGGFTTVALCPTPGGTCIPEVLNFCFQEIPAGSFITGIRHPGGCRRYMIVDHCPPNVCNSEPTAGSYCVTADADILPGQTGAVTTSGGLSTTAINKGQGVLLAGRETILTVTNDNPCQRVVFGDCCDEACVCDRPNLVICIDEITQVIPAGGSAQWDLSDCCDCDSLTVTVTNLGCVLAADCSTVEHTFRISYSCTVGAFTNTDDLPDVTATFQCAADEETASSFNVLGTGVNCDIDYAYGNHLGISCQTCETCDCRTPSVMDSMSSTFGTLNNGNAAVVVLPTQIPGNVCNPSFGSWLLFGAIGNTTPVALPTTPHPDWSNDSPCTGGEVLQLVSGGFTVHQCCVGGLVGPGTTIRIRYFEEKIFRCDGAPGGLSVRFFAEGVADFTAPEICGCPITLDVPVNIFESHSINGTSQIATDVVSLTITPVGCP